MYNIDYNERDISFKLEGKSFDNGYDFNDTLMSLNYFQDILDKAYLTIVNKDRMSKNDRTIYKVKATEIRKGSFIADLMIYTGSAMQIGFSVLNTYYPSLLLDITKQGFEYLKTVLQAEKDGKRISVSNNGDGDVMILNIEGDSNAPIYVGENAFVFADRAYNSIKDLSSMIDDDNVKKINIFDKTEKRNIMKLGMKEKEILNVEPQTDETPIFITGRIFRIDVRAKTGKMIVVKSEIEDLINGEFNFEILDSSDISKCCSVIGREAEFGVFRRIQYDPIKLTNQVINLKVFKVK